MVRGKIEHRCMECDEAISNPICSECLAQRMRITIGETNQKLARAIKGIPTSGGTNCLFCGKEVGVCAHCFSQDVYEFLKEKNQAVAKLFQSQFDFNLRNRLIDFD
ncbi:MAG: hypothetical protein WCV90_07365 [Candidatus Woesearchaeota archaeon]|jgi:hypothetical protein